jgi:hypothetical protein
MNKLLSINILIGNSIKIIVDFLIINKNLLLSTRKVNKNSILLTIILKLKNKVYINKII